MTYDYALFDLGRSLMLGGDPRSAVKVLQLRLQIANQTAGPCRSCSSRPKPAAARGPGVESTTSTTVEHLDGTNVHHLHHQHADDLGAAGDASLGSGQPGPGGAWRARHPSRAAAA